ncbi:hypothetical protein EUGRSUZ_B02766 [Eucalyptus grandis]|uniref:Uncharacterized protein n=2 Tax=Eucalyptus grandis TaxID=71139 RepID=A0A059D775_EUCGR|nr:hypothetical protein EUGRSUZ_B02766 [Eucalyptus grandis]
MKLGFGWLSITLNTWPKRLQLFSPSLGIYKEVESTSVYCTLASSRILGPPHMLRNCLIYRLEVCCIISCGLKILVLFLSQDYMQTKRS